jgi:hypothetical protein
VREVINILEELQMYMLIYFLLYEELKMIILINARVDIYLKGMIKSFLYKIITNLCKTIKVITLNYECDECDDYK